MKISEYIAQLNALLVANGDLDVQAVGVCGDRMAARAPEIAFEYVIGPRERKARFWHHYDGDVKKGKAVVQV